MQLKMIYAAVVGAVFSASFSITMAEVQRRHATMHNVIIPSLQPCLTHHLHPAAFTITPSHYDHIYDLKAPHAVEADIMIIGAQTTTSGSLQCRRRRRKYTSKTRCT
jgi:hypothetical protein